MGGGGVLQIVKERKLWVERTRAVKQNVKGLRPGFNRLLTKWLNLLQPPRIIKDYLEFIPVLDTKPLVTESPKFQVWPAFITDLHQLFKIKLNTFVMSK